MRYAIIFVLLFFQGISLSFSQSQTTAVPLQDRSYSLSASDSTAADEAKVDFKALLKKADFHRGGHVPGISWDLNVKNIEKGKKRNELNLLVEASVNDENLFALINFIGPRKYKGQKLLVRDNNMWFAKPGLRNPVPISSRQRLTGSAANADVASANYFNEYDILSGEAGEYEGQACWVLTLEANSRLVSYPKLTYWISQDEALGLKAEFYGKSGKLIKEATFEYENIVELNSEKHAYVSKVSIYDNINKEDKTLLDITNIRFAKFNSSKFQKNRLLD